MDINNSLSDFLIYFILFYCINLVIYVLRFPLIKIVRFFKGRFSDVLDFGESKIDQINLSYWIPIGPLDANHIKNNF